MNPHEKLWYFINYAKKNSVLTHRSVEDSASPSHLRCPLCWITIPRTEQLGRRTVALRDWVLSCPGEKQEQAGNAGNNWKAWVQQAVSENPQTREGFTRCFHLHVDSSPHGLILNTWFSAGDTVLKKYESFRRWSLAGGGPWGFDSPTPCLFSPCSDMWSEGSWLYALPAMAAIACPPWWAVCL